MKYIIFLITLFVISCSLKVKETEFSNTLDWVIKTFETNDAGFQYVINKKGQADYDKFKAVIKRDMRQAKTIEECQSIIWQYLLYFRKGHVFISIIDSKMKNANNHYVNSFSKGDEKTKPYFTRLSNNTVYLKINSFNYAHKRDIDSLLMKNHSIITSTPNLIIDIRWGTGGSDASFENIIPYLYTNPILENGVEFLATEMNANALDLHATKHADSLRLRNAARRMKGKIGQFVMIYDSVSIRRFEKVYKYPEKVGVICNQSNGSADEQFLIVAKQSCKVKVFGQSTSGVLDISNMNFVDSPNGKFMFGYSMSRSLRIPDYCIDGVGIQPDFFIAKNINENDWVAYTQSVLEKKID